MRAPTPVELDLLIVGGGIQGLTLLHHYTEENLGSVLLVSRDPLGEGETLHSHGYLHKGHFLPPEKKALIPDLMESFQWWNGWMSRNGLRYEDDAPVLFDLSEDRFETVTGIWKAAGLDFEPMTRLPAPLQGGSYTSPAPRRRLVRIGDRLIPPWKILRKLSEPLQDLLLRGELTGISIDPGSNRVVDCTVSTPRGDVVFRPRVLVMAAGRSTQRLLAGATGPDGSRPLRGAVRELNVIRDVPMVLIQGDALPALSGWFFLEAPITMMTHPLEDGRKMWVVTLMEGHRTSREDFTGDHGPVDGAVIHRTLQALWNMVPGLRTAAPRLRFASYLGGKIDHPEGHPTWFIGEVGLENLRIVWPVLWGLAHSASRRLIRDIWSAPSAGLDGGPAGKRFDAAKLALPTGIEVGTESRLSPSLNWSTLEEWEGAHGFSL